MRVLILQFSKMQFLQWQSDLLRRYVWVIIIIFLIYQWNEKVKQRKVWINWWISNGNLTQLNTSWNWSNSSWFIGLTLLIIVGMFIGWWVLIIMISNELNNTLAWIAGYAFVLLWVILLMKFRAMVNELSDTSNTYTMRRFKDLEK